MRKYSIEELNCILRFARQGKLGQANHGCNPTFCIEQAARPNELPREGFYKRYDSALGKTLPERPNEEEILTWLTEEHYL